MSDPDVSPLSSEDIAKYLPRGGKTWTQDTVDQFNTALAGMDAAYSNTSDKVSSLASKGIAFLEKQFPAFAQAEDYAAQALQSTFGSSDGAKLALQELHDNSKAVEALKGRYAKRDGRFGEMSTPEFVANILAQHPEADSLAKVDNLIKDLNKAEDNWEQAQMTAKKEAVIGINNSSWWGSKLDSDPVDGADMYKKLADDDAKRAGQNPYKDGWWASVGHSIAHGFRETAAAAESGLSSMNHATGSYNYSDETLKTLNKQDTDELKNKFVELYSAEISHAKEEIEKVKGATHSEAEEKVRDNQALGIVLTAVGQVNKEGKASAGRDFHYQVYEKVTEIAAKMAKGPAQSAETVYDKNGDALIHAVVSAGETQFNGAIFANGSPDRKQDIVNKFNAHFHEELQAAKKAGLSDDDAVKRVLTATETVYKAPAPDGNANGTHPIPSEDRYHRVVMDELTKELTPASPAVSATPPQPADKKVAGTPKVNAVETATAVTAVAAGSKDHPPATATAKTDPKTPPAAPASPANENAEASAEDKKRAQAEAYLLNKTDNFNWEKSVGRTAFDGEIKQHSNNDFGAILGTHRDANAILTVKDVQAIDKAYTDQKHGKALTAAEVANLEKQQLHGEHEVRVAAAPKVKPRETQPTAHPDKNTPIPFQTLVDKITSDVAAETAKVSANQETKKDAAAHLALDNAILPIIAEEMDKGRTSISPEELGQRLLEKGISRDTLEHSGNIGYQPLVNAQPPKTQQVTKS